MPGQDADERTQQARDDVATFELPPRNRLLKQFDRDSEDGRQHDGDDAGTERRPIVVEGGDERGGETAVAQQMEELVRPVRSEIRVVTRR